MKRPRITITRFRCRMVVGLVIVSVLLGAPTWLLWLGLACWAYANVTIPKGWEITFWGPDRYDAPAIDRVRRKLRIRT